MKRYILKYEHWPEADRQMWQGLVADDLFAAGAGARWRPKTKEIFVRDYGFWLAFLKEEGVALCAETPANRVTRARIRAYISSLADLAPSTRCARVRALSVLMPRIDSGNDWGWLHTARQRLDHDERRERGMRKRQWIVATHKLFEAGVSYLQAAIENQNGPPIRRALAVRDGLMIALLAARPLRISNFASLRLDDHITRTHDGFRIDIRGDETKNGQPFETVVPTELVPHLSSYLDTHRRVLLAGREHNYLWVSHAGKPTKAAGLGLRISAITQKLMSKRTTPHLFRDCAATTIATADPDHVGTIMPLLGHRSPATAERHYNQARTLEAGRAHQANLRQLRAGSPRPLGYRRSRRES